MTLETPIPSIDARPGEIIRNGMKYRLETITYTSPEFNEIETVVEIPEPIYAAEKTASGPGERAPEPMICISPEFDEIETFI